MSIKGGSAGDIATGVACGVGYLVIFLEVRLSLQQELPFLLLQQLVPLV
ncbi:hypothetical protein SAMN06269250_0964 [Spirosoma fluviale]|uniref:Uncharacterized protein n=2 Tax=Spirosoma fluviale TaxID=1597977 RepID=A0A286F8C9_9BACT|nr:hypothetical protein SAMN06269250_0964 [Spirosoma fluviale]